jgi:hypothetical protein
MRSGYNVPPACGGLVLTTVLVIDGLLRMPESDGHYDEGVTLYRALAQASRLYLISAEWDSDEMDQWLFKRQLKGHVGFQKAISPSPPDRTRALGQISSWRPALIFEGDPACAAHALAAGYPVCLMVRPTYRDPRWQPDHSRTPEPWGDIMTEKQRQEDLWYLDARMREEDS